MQGGRPGDNPALAELSTSGNSRKLRPRSARTTTDSARHTESCALGIIGAVFVGFIEIGAIANGGSDSSSNDKASTAIRSSPAADKPEQQIPEAEKVAALGLHLHRRARHHGRVALG